MLGVYDFCGHYEWTFSWLEARGGNVVVQEFWDKAIHQDSQQHASALIRSQGIEGMKLYWGHALSQEGAGYKTSASDSAFRLDILDCPSKGFLLRNGLEQYSDYCDHCIGWIGPMLERSGFVIDHQHNHCGQCWWEMRQAKDGTAPGLPDSLQSDARLHPNWLPKTQTIDTFAAATSARQKQPPQPATVQKQTRGWERLPPLPVPSGNFACGVVERNLLIAGGVTWTNNTKVWLQKIWTFDPDKRVWSPAGELPHPMAYTAYGQAPGGIYLLGGGSGSNSLFTGAVLTPALQGWRGLEFPRPLYYAGASVWKNNLYLTGGTPGMDDLTNCTASFCSVDLKTGRIEPLSPFPAGPVFVPAAAAIGGSIYIFGGAWQESAAGPVINRDDAYAYSIADRKWSRLQPLPQALRGVAACVLDDRHILLAGGYGEDFTDAAMVYDIRNGAYAAVKSLPYAALVHLVRIGPQVYCFGSEDKMRHRTDLCYRLDIEELLKNR